MKSVIEQNNVQRIGIQSEGTFRIKATGKAFRILSDGLYSDKITAIIRELSCNAYDAHVEAGNLARPFRIHLPTQFEPYFSLRDYGIGLSDEDVTQVYTTYFESTKTHSNDLIGCLGLGSKSPFSYVDNFNIVSYFNGEKRTYTAFMNEEGIPACAPVSVESTTEHNGIEVSFAVSQNDFRSFYSRIPTVFRYFKIQPEIVGHKDVTIEPVTYGLQGSGWGIRTNDNYGARAIMGNVSYPLNDMDKDKVTEEEWALIQSNIDIMFGIGELEVAASRENISFNKQTVQNVKDRLAVLVKEVSKKVTDELNNCPTLWDARILAVELSNSTYASLKPIFKVGEITYKGQKIEGGLGSTIVGIPKDIRDELSIDVFAPRQRRRRKSRYSSYSDSDPIISVVKDPQGISVRSGNEFRFFIKDIDKGSHVRCKQVINNDNNDVDTVYLVEEKTAGTIDKLMEVLGYEGDVEPISSIERPKRGSNSTAEYNPMNAKKMLVYQSDTNQHDEDEKSSYWTTDKVDFRHGGIYVIIDRYKVQGSFLADKYIEPFLRALKTIGEDVSSLKVVGVKSAMSGKVNNDKDWVQLREYVQKKVNDYVVTNGLRGKLIKARAHTNMMNGGDSSRLATFINNGYGEWNLADDSIVMEYVKLMEECKEAKQAVQAIEVVYANLNMSWIDDAATVEIDKLVKERSRILGQVRDTYPMIRMVMGGYDYDAKIVADYIAMVDRTNKNT